MASLISTDWQFEANGLLLGSGTSYDVRVIAGLAGSAPVRGADVQRTLRHGSRAGSDFLAPRQIILEFDIMPSATETFDDLLQALSQALPVAEDEYEIAFQVPGVANGVTARILGRTRKRDIGVDLEYFYGYAKPRFQIIASDPRIYAEAQSLAMVGLPTTEGGRTYPRTYPRTYGSVSTGGTITANNAGTFSTPVVFTLTGPATNPTIENVTQGKSLEFNIVLASGETLVIDTDSRTVLLNGTASRYSALMASSEWFDLDPGDNQIDYRAATSTISEITATWRSAWS